MDIVSGILNAIASIPKIGAMVERWIGYAVAWWMNRQTNITMSMIVDAAAAQARAENQDERIKANSMWRETVSRKRIV